MLFDHIMFDFTDAWINWAPAYSQGSFIDVMGKFASEYWLWPVREGFRVIVIGIFFVTCGISSSFSRSNLMRGGCLLLVAFGVSMVTIVGDRLFHTGIIIYFGVLHCLALSILIYELMKKLGVPRWGILCCAAAMMTFGAYIYAGTGLIASNDFFAIFGLATNKYWNTSDYFPLLPWAGMVLLGGLVGEVFYGGRQSLLPRAQVGYTRPVQFIGRHSLIIYVLHQLVIYGIFQLVGTLVYG